MTTTPLNRQRINLAKAALSKGIEQLKEHGRELSAQTMLAVLEDVMDTVHGLTKEELLNAGSELKTIGDVLGDRYSLL
jgi:hypothetical protein